MTYQEILKFALLITKDQHIAHDMVHDLYISLHKQGVDMFNTDKPRSYIFVGLKRRFIDYYRKYKSLNTYEEERPSINRSKVVFADNENVVVDATLPDQTVIYTNLIEEAKKQVRIGFKNTFKNQNQRKELFCANEDKYLTIFDLIVKGEFRSEIAEVMKCSPQNIRFYHNHIKKWTQPILKP